MSIPKIIHYCWFGGNPKPTLAIKCIKSWKKYCPDYDIIEWNEGNFDISSAPLYVRQAYEAKKWAFVTDYVRLKIVYDNGGIYLDTDVELIKTFDEFLHHNAFFGFENISNIATGLGFGAIKGASILSELMADYNDIPFILPDGSFDTLTCPIRNTRVFLKFGLIQNNKFQIIHDNTAILPSSYLCPIDYASGKKTITADTISIHWFSATWHSADEKLKRIQIQKRARKHRRKENFKNLTHNVSHLPNKVMRFLLKDERYEKLKNKLKR